MKPSSILPSSILRLWWILLALVFHLSANGQEGRQFPLGPIGGYFSVSGNSSLALVRSVDAGGAGANAGLQAGDYIYGAFGKIFTPTGGIHYGVTQELGFAVDRAEAGDGILPLLVMRPGTGGITINVALSAAGAFGPAYPRNSPKYAGAYEYALSQLHLYGMNGSSANYLLPFTGLSLLGSPYWNDTTGAKPYRLSINSIRNKVVSTLNSAGYAPKEEMLPDGSRNPNYQSGMSNWTLGSYVMFLSEYYAKTGDTSVLPALQRGAEICANTVQWWKQPRGPAYDRVLGMNGHHGVTGDYLHSGWFSGFNAAGVHVFSGLAFARRAGVNMEVRPKDGHYYGYNVNPGDPIPAGLVNALPSSITLPQYAADPDRGSIIQNTSSPVNRSDASDPLFYNPSLAQKFLMQMHYICRRSMANGMVRYAPEVSNDPDSVRTAGALLGFSMYQSDVGGLDSADLDRLESMKQRISVSYMAQQYSHSYTFTGGQIFHAFCAPFLSDRQQRFSLDNWRFYYALSRTANNGIRYISSRNGEDSAGYLDNNNCILINYALPYGIANGGFSLIPAYNTNRTLANFKSPFLMWPSLAARTCTVNTASQEFQVDVCDGDGNVLDPSAYTAAWSHVSGPDTATFSSDTTSNTTVTFPSVSATPYRIRLTVSRAGVPDLVEDIDVTRAVPPTPVAPSIATQPVAQSSAPGGNVSFTVGTAGDGPFIYQWKLDGVAYWVASPNPTLTLTNVSAGNIGTYECVITTPTGTLVSSPASFTLNASLTRVANGLKKEVWTGITGVNVSDLTSNQKFPRFTTTTGVVTAAEGQMNTDNCGERLSGWVKPPVTGDYRFYMSGDDAAELWLSTDASPANKVRIVDHPSISSFRSYDGVSANIPLVAGQKYYIEILHKEAGGSDHVSVAWQMPGEAAPMPGTAPIPGIYLEYDFYLPLLTNRWTFDETSGATRADSVGGATATLYNGPAPVAGQIDGALGFNGVNQYAKATVDVSEKIYAVSLWFRTTQSGGGIFSVVDEGTGNDRNIYLKNGNIFARVYNNQTISSKEQNYSDGQWHHVVHTFGGAINWQRLYVDGVEVAAGAKGNSDFTWQTAVKIGYSADASPAQYFNGQIDDVRVYNAALPVGDAAALYNAGVNASPQVSAATFSVVENSANGTSVGTVSATDSNAGQALSYSIVGGNVGNRFAIGASTGVITVNGIPDYEGINSFLLNVRVTDSGTSAASADAVITVNVTNVNEAPLFVANPMRGPSTAAGMAYSGDLAATDQDAGDSMAFMKTSGPAWLSVASNGTLSGTASSGDIGLNTFVVRVTDAGGAWTEVPLQISVVNLSSQPLWINPAGGSWPTAGNWFSGTVANGASMTADFSAADLTANAAVTLDGSRTIGGLVFGDTDNQFGWTVSPGTGGTLTLDAASAPVVEVFNQSVTLGMPVAGTKGISKTGAGVLSLIGANTYTGATSVNAGTFRVGNGTTVGTLSSSSAISIASGAAAMWFHSSSYTIANTISGNGQWILNGTNASNALHQSIYTPTATNSGFTGELLLDGAMTWNITNPTRLGNGSIRIRNSGTLGLNGTSIANPVTVESGSGWHHNINGSDVVLGLMRLEGTNTLSGNIQLNQSTGVVLGDNSGANSTFGAYNTSNNTLSGVISGTGELSMSRFTGWNGGAAQVVDFSLTGTSSNSFTGRTVVDGQGAKASLRLMKTGGAVAIPGGNTVQFGSNTGGQANLRMGDTTATGTARNQWNNQFGTGNGGVLLNFVNSSGNWMRFDLQGTQQSVAGLVAGTDLTQGGAIMQNQSFSAFDPGQDATLTLIGSGNYVYNGIVRDQDNGGTTRKLHLVKSGSGTQTLAGTSLSYSGSTTINGGTLRISGTLASSPVTVNSGGKLDGTGTINSPVTLAAGGTLAAGDDDFGTLKFGNTLTLDNAGTVALRIDKAGTTSADNINLTGTEGLELHGKLKVTLVNEVSELAAGDRFTLFTVASGGISGDFDAFDLPTLPATLRWSTGNLTVDGSISVEHIPPASSPVFTPAGGNYFAAQSLTISSDTDGATIRYTTDGSDPVTSGTAISGTTPITGIDVPCPGTLTVKAYAFKENFLDSVVVTSDYATVPADSVTWTNPAGGSWPSSGNWQNGIVANGSDLTARFDTLALSGNTSVTLDGAKTLGGATFGDAGNLYSWTIAPGSGGSLTLAGASAPVLKVNNQSAFIGVPLAGTQGFTKTGAGMLVLSGANTYTGATTINQGTLQIGIGTNAGSIHATSPVTVATGAAAMWWRSDAPTIANSISGSGQWILQGTNATNALAQSNYTPTGNNSGFTGELLINRAIVWNVTNASQIGSGLVRVQDRGTLSLNGGASVANTISIENGAGWHHNVGGDVVIGAIRMEGTNTFSGNLQLNQNTGVINGDNSGAYSTLGSWAAATNTFSGVISGGGELSMSRFTSYNSGSVQTVNMDLTGTASNTYTGRTVVDGQGGVASLRLAKTGGAVAIRGGNVVQLGSVTGGQANLRIGDTTATGATRNQWDNQFGTTNGGVLLNFVNASGQWMRFGLQGTQQSVAGLNAGSELTMGGAVVENQNLLAFDPGQDATLTLIGSGSYLYNGYFNDQIGNGTTRKLHLVKAGTGTQALIGTAIFHTGATTVNGGTLKLQNTTGFVSAVTTGASGTLELNRTAIGFASRIRLTGLVSGTGTLNVNNATAGIGGGWVTFNSASTGLSAFTGTINVNSGVLSLDNLVGAWSGNPDLNVVSGGLFAIRGQNISVDALSGNGDVFNSNTTGGAAGKTLTVGVANGSGTFSGVIHGSIGSGGTDGAIEQGILNLSKVGTGTQTLSGANTYKGTTVISGGTLQVNGSLANGVVTVTSSGTLGGNGTLGGATTVQSGGTLAPGDGGIGTLTVNNTVTLSGTTQMEVSKSGATLTADRLSATTLNHGGTLVVTHTGPAALAAGDSFTLFSSTTRSGSFTSVQLPTLAANLVWDTSTLYTNGSIRIRALPVAVNDSIAVAEDGSVNVPVLTNDSDSDGDTLSIQFVTQGAHGSVSNGGSGVTYTPAANWNGTDTFTYTITDSHEGIATATVNVTVTPVNDTPVFTANPIAGTDAAEDSAYPGTLVGTVTDIDAGETLTYSKVSGPAWLGVASNGAFSGTPANSDIGENSFTVKVTDAAGANATATLNITVTNVNDAPIWAGGTITKADASEAIAYSASLAGDASDEDAGDTLTYSKVSGPAWLSVASNGTLSGTPTFSDLGANAFTVRATDISGASADATLSINVTSANGVWTNIAGGTWPTGTNWSGGTVANGMGRTADFGTLNLTADTTVTLDGGRTIGNLVFGDTTPSHHWTLNAGSGGVLTLDVASGGTPAITVNNQTVSIGVPLAGNEGLQKTGAGRLVLSGAASNTYTGNTTLTGTGQLVLAKSGGAVAVPKDMIMAATGARAILSATQNNQFGTTSVMRWSGSGDNRFELNGTTQTLAGIDSSGFTPGTFVAIQHREFAVDAAVGTTSALVLNVAGSDSYTFGGTNMVLRDYTGGTLSLTKNGTGTQTLKGAGITYSGATAVNAGTLVYSGVNADWPLPAGTKTVSSGATLKVDFTPQTTQYRKTNFGPTAINTGGVLELYGTADNVNGFYLINGGEFSGAGAIRVTGGGATNVWTTANALSGFTGLLDIQNGRFGCNVASGSTLGGTLDVNIAATGKLDLRSGNFTIDALDGAAGSSVTKSWTGDTVNFTIGSGNGTGTFAGVMQGTNYNIIKTGTGTQAFSGANTYTGTTTVNGGTLRVNGSLANGTVTVASGGTLGGTGTIGGAVTVSGTLAPGSNDIGTLAINNTLGLSGTAQMEISKSGGTLAADKVSGVSTVTYGGTLTVTNIGPDALVAGNTFQLFSATAYSGSFATLNLPTLDSGLAWDTSRLTADGTIAVFDTENGGLPAGWAKADIGSPSIAGTSSESAGVFTLAGSGTGFANGSDQAHFIWQTLSGDGEVKVRLGSMSGGDATNATAGVMIRESTLAGSRFASCIRKGDGSMQLIRRLSSGGAITTTTNGTNSTPVWVRLVRAGNIITAYKSTDGSSWTTVGTDTVTMASQISIGVLTSSGNNTSSTTATFDNVIIVP